LLSQYDQYILVNNSPHVVGKDSSREIRGLECVLVYKSQRRFYDTLLDIFNFIYVDNLFVVSELYSGVSREEESVKI